MSLFLRDLCELCCYDSCKHPSYSLIYYFTGVSISLRLRSVTDTIYFTRFFYKIIRFDSSFYSEKGKF